MTDDRSAFTEARAAGKAKQHEQRLARARATRSDPAAGHDWTITRTGDAVDIRVVDRAGNDILIPADLTEAWRLALGLLEAIRGTSSRPCRPGCEFVAPHPSHPCGQYTRERP